MSVTELEQGRSAYERRQWLDAYTALSTADAAAPLGVDDERLATAASMVGRMDEFDAARARASSSPRAERIASGRPLRRHDRDEPRCAARWDRQAAGSRAPSASSIGKRDCVERGYLLLPVVFQRKLMGDLDGASDAAAAAAEIGERFGERDPRRAGAPIAGHGADQPGPGRRRPEAVGRSDGGGDRRRGLAVPGSKPSIARHRLL